MDCINNRVEELLEKNSDRVDSIPIDALSDVEVTERPLCCKYCFNARVYEPTEEEMMNPFATELTDDNDSTSCGVGRASTDLRLMISSGNSEPLRIEVDKWNNSREEWVTVGKYYPKYCPECGRRLNEYES